MQDKFKAAIAQIAVFMICAQTIAHFRPKEAYEKYLRMLLSVMILLQIFQPFCRLIFGVAGQEFSTSIAQFQMDLESSMKEANLHAEIAGQKLEEMSLSEVQERLAEQQEEASVVEQVHIDVEISQE